ncbi:MAG: Phosphoenolpyruvate synthase [Candidatus Yanofskybacteria bacterium GW2011_GWA1_44_21]|nr:MAG: Phosphoenolpyruvate synthase [Candidatus Yanofskybacteria bacterium GW2011_GWA1_44_21]
MELIKNFNEIKKTDSLLAGGKGSSLGEMTQAGLPVPDGFVVLSGTFDRFLHETDLAQEIEAILKTVDHKAIHTVEGASEKIRGLIENEELPQDISDEILRASKALRAEFVAVRSSATAEDGAEHAWAGQLESYLNTTEDDLMLVFSLYSQSNLLSLRKRTSRHGYFRSRCGAENGSVGSIWNSVFGPSNYGG